MKIRKHEVTWPEVVLAIVAVIGITWKVIDFGVMKSASSHADIAQTIAVEATTRKTADDTLRGMLVEHYRQQNVFEDRIDRELGMLIAEVKILLAQAHMGNGTE